MKREHGQQASGLYITHCFTLHNHPEGLPVPSDADFEITRRFEEIAAPFDIALVDHLIVTAQNAYSIKTGKLL